MSEQEKEKNGMVVRSIDTPVVNQEEENDMEELKGLALKSGIQAMFSGNKAQEMLKLADPFVKKFKPKIFNHFGKDQIRYMLYRDEETGALVVLKLYTEKMKLEFENPDPKDVFIIQEQEINSVDDIMKKLAERFGGMFMSNSHK